MWKQFTYNGNHKWIDLLPRRKHRIIGMQPIDVILAISDKLLITVLCSLYPRDLKWTWYAWVNSKQFLRKVKHQIVQKTNFITYLLKDSCGKPIAGEFYEYELHRVANSDVYLVEKVSRKRMKWLGFNNSHNSWIYKDNVLWKKVKINFYYKIY